MGAIFSSGKKYKMDQKITINKNKVKACIITSFNQDDDGSVISFDVRKITPEQEFQIIDAMQLINNVNLDVGKYDGYVSNSEDRVYHIEILE